MNRGFIKKAFGAFRKREYHILKYPICVYEKRKKGFKFKLQGVTQHIFFYISKTGRVEVWATFKDIGLYDILTDFDLIEKRDNSGKYYCDLCILKNREYYNTRNELWEKHSFEPLFHWINEKLTDSNYLCFFDYGKGQEAKIVDEIEYKQWMNNKNMVYSVPIINH